MGFTFEWLASTLSIVQLFVWIGLISIFFLMIRYTSLDSKNNFFRIFLEISVLFLISAPFLFFGFRNIYLLGMEVFLLTFIFVILLKIFLFLLDKISTLEAELEFNKNNKEKEHHLDLEKIYLLMNFLAVGVAIPILILLIGSPFRLISIFLLLILFFIYAWHLSKRENKPSPKNLFYVTLLPFLIVNIMLSISFLLLFLSVLSNYVSSLSLILVGVAIIPVFLIIFVQKWILRDPLKNLAENKEITQKTIKTYFIGMWIAFILTIILSDVPTFLSVRGTESYTSWLYGFIIFVVYTIVFMKKEEKLFKMKYLDK